MVSAWNVATIPITQEFKNAFDGNRVLVFILKNSKCYFSQISFC